jgi:hypothetical protein
MAADQRRQAQQRDNAFINGHPNRDIDQLLPSAYQTKDFRAVA